VIVGVDPGRSKCGLAAVSPEGVIERAVVAAEVVAPQAAELARRHSAAAVVVGSRTGSREVLDAVAQALPNLPVEPVEEHLTTLLARRRYWQENPSGCLMRLIPEGMREPPEPFDDWAAVLLAERYLAAASRDATQGGECDDNDRAVSRAGLQTRREDRSRP